MLLVLLAAIGFAETPAARLRHAWKQAGNAPLSDRGNIVLRAISKELGSTHPRPAAAKLMRLVGRAFTQEHGSGITTLYTSGPITVSRKYPGIVVRLNLDWPDPREFQPDGLDGERVLAWFGWQKGRWTYQVLETSGNGIGTAYANPTDAIVANGRLILVGGMENGSNSPCGGAYVFHREGGRWSLVQCVEEGECRDWPKLARRNGIKQPNPLQIVVRRYGEWVSSGHIGPCETSVVSYRWNGRRYVNAGAHALMTPVRVLDLMVGWAHERRLGLAMSRCASVRIFKRFLGVVKRAKKEALVLTVSDHVRDDSEHLILPELGYRFDFVRARRGYLLKSVRRWSN